MYNAYMYARIREMGYDQGDGIVSHSKGKCSPPHHPNKTWCTCTRARAHTHTHTKRTHTMRQGVSAGTHTMRQGVNAVSTPLIYVQHICTITRIGSRIYSPIWGHITGIQAVQTKKKACTGPDLKIYHH